MNFHMLNVKLYDSFGAPTMLPGFGLLDGGEKPLRLVPQDVVRWKNGGDFNGFHVFLIKSNDTPVDPCPFCAW